MIEAHQIVPPQGPFDLVQVGGDGPAQHRMVLGNDRSPERRREGHGASRLQPLKPAVPVVQNLGIADRVPETGRVAQTGLVCDQHPVELCFNPVWAPVDDVDFDPGLFIVPGVAGIPELQAQIEIPGPQPVDDGDPLFQGDRRRDIDVQVDVRAGVAGAGSQ